MVVGLQQFIRVDLHVLACCSCCGAVIVEGGLLPRLESRISVKLLGGMAVAVSSCIGRVILFGGMELVVAVRSCKGPGIWLWGLSSVAKLLGVRGAIGLVSSSWLAALCKQLLCLKVIAETWALAAGSNSVVKLLGGRGVQSEWCCQSGISNRPVDGGDEYP